MMDKPKYRYNHKTKVWDRLYSFDTSVYEITGFRNPTTGMGLTRKLYEFDTKLIK